MKRAAALVFAVVFVLAACGDDDDDTTASSTTTTSTTSETSTSSTATTELGPVADVALKLTEIARLDQPLALAVRSGTDGLYLAEKTGHVQHLAAPGAPPELVLDIAGEVSTGGEQGLLGLTFSPDGTKMYVSYTNVDGNTRLEEVDPDSGDRQEIFAIDQPYANHNGGHIIFGPDGKLWFGLGDGGAGGDPHDNGQDPDALLGKILRFDPATWEPEIYALGARNPWRFSFDRETDDLWVGDVGQNEWEEIDLIAAGTPAGVNLGWNLLEGSHPFEANEAPGTLLPVYEYGRDAGQSVVGGYVYRGTAIPGLASTYLFADTYTGALWALRAEGDAYAFTDLDIDVPGGLVSSFGEDADGELYVMSLDGGVYRIDAA